METVLKKCIIILLLMCLIGLSEQQAVFKKEIFDTISEDGPIAKSLCKVTFPVGSTQHTIIWEYGGHQIAVNGTGTEHISDRTYVEYFELRNEEWTHSSILSIYGAVKNDEREGNYQCLAEYFIGNTKNEDQDTIFIPITYYLPPPDYPMCSASQSVFYDGHNVTFICDPGESNPPVDLKLVLQGHDGNKTHLGNLPKVTAMMTHKNNHSRFVFYMTSANYKSFTRQCSFGPIVVLPPTETSTAPTETSTEGHTTSIIIGTVVAGILVIIASTFIIICLVIKRSKTSAKSSNHPMDIMQSGETATQNPYTPTSISTESPNPTSNADSSMQVYSDADREDIPNYEDAGSIGPKSTSSASDQSKLPQGQAFDKHDKETDADQEIPVYAISSKSSGSEDKSGGENKRTNDMPIYSQVNKDSGMVENMIYEPAGPV